MKNSPDIYGRLPIHFATVRAGLAMMRLLEISGCSIHAWDREGRSLLHIDVTRDTQTRERKKALENITKWLIKNGYHRAARNNGIRIVHAPSWALDLLQVPPKELMRAIHATEPGFIHADEMSSKPVSPVPGEDYEHPIVIHDMSPHAAFTTSSGKHPHYRPSGAPFSLPSKA